MPFYPQFGKQKKSSLFSSPLVVASMSYTAQRSSFFLSLSVCPLVVGGRTDEREKLVFFSIFSCV